MPMFERPYEEAMALFDNTVNDAERDLAERGLLMSQRPSNRAGDMTDRPELPPDMDECTWAELQQLLGSFTSWFAYAKGQYHVAVGRRNLAAEGKTYTWARVRKGKEGTVSDKDDSTRIDSRYQDSQVKFEYYESMVEMLKGIVEGIAREIETVSRAITVMELRQNSEGRGVGAGKKAHRGEAQAQSTRQKREVWASFRGSGRRGK